MISRAIFVVDRKARLNYRLNDIEQDFKYVSSLPFDFDNKLSALNSSTLIVDSSIFVSDEHRSHLFYRQLKYKRANFNRTYLIYHGSVFIRSNNERSVEIFSTINSNYRNFEVSFRKIIRDVRMDDPNSELYILVYTDQIVRVDRSMIEKIYDSNVRLAQIKCSYEDMIEDMRAFAHMRMHLKEFNYKSVTQVARSAGSKKPYNRRPQKYIAPPGLSKWKFDGLGHQSEIWQLDPLNFESKNRGSREDGLQQLQYAKMIPAYAKAAETVIRYFAKCDPALSVRRAARQALDVEVEFRSEFRAETLSKFDTREIFDEFVRIPSGEFLMGSTIENDVHSLPAEEPAHKVYIDEFYMMKRALSIGDWSKIILTNNIEYDNFGIPKTELNWFECQSIALYLEKSFLHWGFISPNQRVCLPSEAEWEKAARGIDGRLYPWGQGSAADMCNCRESGFDRVLPSGYFSPKGDSPYGIQDMAGNVWQWTRSLWGETLRKPSFQYPYDKHDGREDESALSSIRRVVRGGAFYYFHYCVRSSVRNAMFPGTRHTGGGVRFIISSRLTGR